MAIKPKYMPVSKLMSFASGLARCGFSVAVVPGQKFAPQISAMFTKVVEFAASG